MPKYRHRKALGLEYDAYGARAVVVRRRGDSWRILDALHLPWQQEGILSASEQQRAIRDWLQERHIGSCACCGGVPQPDFNTVINDFPPVRNREQLARMVSYQARQLDGLADEQFLHGFQPLIPLPGQTNPLLIAVSRESLLNQRLQHFQAMGLRIEQLTSTGLALLNAFETLQPDAAEQPNLQLVVDFGAESSVLAIYCQGRIQQLVALTTSAQPHATATAPSPAHALAREIRDVLQDWKSLHPGENSLLTPSQLWLSGVGALNAEAAEILAESLQTPVQLLGLAARKCAPGIPTGGAVGGVCPALTIALGLALQATGNAPCTISIIPERLAWQQRKQQAAIYLALTALVVALALVAGLHLFNQNLRNATEELQKRHAELDQALALCPKLDQAYQKLAYYQRRILPVAETGFRTQRFMETLQVWLAAIPDHAEEDTWCFYLADEFSFAQANTPPTNGGRRAREEDDAGDRATRTRSSKTAEPTTPPPARPTLLIGGATSAPAEESSETNPRPMQATEGEATAENVEPVPVVYPPVTSVAQIPFLTAMYAGGFVPSRGNKYQLVKRLQEQLNLSDTFANVDDFADFLSPDFKETHLAPWEAFLEEHREGIGQEHLFFFLQMPFREAPVKRPAN